MFDIDIIYLRASFVNQMILNWFIISFKTNNMMCRKREWFGNDILEAQITD
jgi:hypothetical protein